MPVITALTRAVTETDAHLDAGVCAGQFCKFDAPAVTHVPETHLPIKQNNSKL